MFYTKHKFAILILILVLFGLFFSYSNLDIYWLDDEKIVGKDFLPSIEKSKKVITKTSPAPVNKVIEIIK